MATQPEVVKQSDLLNQLVLDRNTMEELGHVDVVWMHPPVHRVLGFICKSGFLGTKKTAFNLAQITTLGANSILVNAQPVETDSEKVRKLESLLDCEVWSDAGNKIGRITDCLFNLKTGLITQYLFVSSGWGGMAGEIYLLLPSKVLSFGRKRVLVSEAAAQTLTVYREGIKQKLTKARNIFKEDYIQVTQEVRSLAKQAQAATEQAKERAQILAEQAKEKVHSLNQQLKEETQTFAKQAQEKSQILVEQVKERAQTVSEQVKEKRPAIEKNIEVPPTPSPATTSNVTATEDDDEPWI
ncbi:PRC-barrel domain-containing protein [Chroococcidiopsis sp. CCMEE 29]|uniref:PRC-barrel domain-containing protein n=1 Tax=Chroococcidiopsis sp. CCMEE 29 TaxID=155894 RepID=UPI0020213B1E|nr:PRC-barrel domain-containing protein [Chroococcidiopsis sp. CCMEE 29]